MRGGSKLCPLGGSGSTPCPPLPSPRRAGRDGSSAGAEGRSGPAGRRRRRRLWGRTGTRSRAPHPAERPSPGAMPLPCRGWTLALLTLLVGFLIFADISEIEEENG